MESHGRLPRRERDKPIAERNLEGGPSVEEEKKAAQLLGRIRQLRYRGRLSKEHEQTLDARMPQWRTGGKARGVKVKAAAK